MTLSEAVKTIKEYCLKTECENCVFCKSNEYVLIEDYKIWDCKLDETPCKWKEPPETNLYDEEEIHENATVQILRNSITGEESIGWWENGN